MALRRLLGFSDGEIMRSDAKPCSQLMKQTAGLCSVEGALGFWVLCRLHYGLSSILFSLFGLMCISSFVSFLFPEQLLVNSNGTSINNCFLIDSTIFTYSI